MNASNHKSDHSKELSPANQINRKHDSGGTRNRQSSLKKNTTTLSEANQNVNFKHEISTPEKIEKRNLQNKVTCTYDETGGI